MESLNFVKGDLIKIADKGYFDMILHGCNCFGVVHSETQKKIDKRWPPSIRLDKLTRKGKREKLGLYTLVFVKTESERIIGIVSAYTQFKPLMSDFRIEALRKVLERLRVNMKASYKDLNFVIPQEGFGANKEEVVKMLLDDFSDFKITILVDGKV